MSLKAKGYCRNNRFCLLQFCYIRTSECTKEAGGCSENSALVTEGRVRCGIPTSGKQSAVSFVIGELCNLESVSNLFNDCSFLVSREIMWVQLKGCKFSPINLLL